MPGIETSLRQELFLFVAQLEGRRLIVMGEADIANSPAHQAMDKPAHRSCPSLLVLHHPDLPARAPGDSRVVVVQLETRVGSDDGEIPVRVTLLEQP